MKHYCLCLFTLMSDNLGPVIRFPHLTEGCHSFIVHLQFLFERLQDMLHILLILLHVLHTWKA